MGTDRIEILGAYGAKSIDTGMTCIKIDKDVVIDAGNILFSLGNGAKKINHIVLSHSHLDHIIDIPFLIDTYFAHRKEPIRIYGLKETIDNVKKYLFNWKLWPDFSKIRIDDKNNSIIFEILELNKEYKINSTIIKPVKNNHMQGSCGYVIKKQNSSVLFTSDTYLCQNLIDEINQNDSIKAVLFDVSFPSAYEQLAKDSKHLTPKLLAQELKKINRDILIFINHIKPYFKNEIINELKKYLSDYKYHVLVDGSIIDIENIDTYNLKTYFVNIKDKLNELINIGYALASEKKFDILLEKILVAAKNFTNADGGTIYIMSEDKKYLEFKVVQTDSLDIKMGGSAGEITWPSLLLYDKKGNENLKNVAAVCALKDRLVNIPDVYKTDEFNFEGTKKFDANTGYRSKSMLVIPMKNHEGDIIGVLQLINKIGFDGDTIPFGTSDEKIILALASQAAVSITNKKLIENLEGLLSDFIQSIASAINEKSKYTGGHINRVAELAVIIAEGISQDKSGKYKNINFTKDELHQLDIAAWMHDIGKITTPEYVVDKATKLETIFDRIEYVKLKCELLKKDCEIELLKGRLTEKEFNEKINNINEIIKFLEKVNKGGEFLPDDDFEKIQRLKNIKIKLQDKELPLLSENEAYNLSIKKGTLTDEERDIINNHVIVSYNMLKKLRFPKKLKRVPVIAGSHHKKVRLKENGEHDGYGAKEIMKLPMSIEDKILALADVFEAITASDRPYRKPNTLNQSLKILTFMAKDGELDYELVKYFIDNKLYEEYAKNNLKPEQIDEVTVKLD